MATSTSDRTDDASTSPVRIGIIGAGGFGMGNARKADQDPQAEIAAVADVSPEARDTAASAFDLPAGAVFEDYMTMIGSADIDAVVITTPHTLHYEQLVAAVDAGLHVLCEKPLVTGVENARAVVELDHEVDTVIMPGYQRHIEPSFVAAREWWSEHGDIPCGISAGITQDWIQTQRGTWRTNPDLSGGGFLYDTGSHVLDAVLWVTGLTPAWVSADMTFDDDEQRVDSSASLLVGFEEGSTANVSLAGDVHEVYEHHHIWTQGAGMQIESEGWEDRMVRTRNPNWTGTFRGGGENTDKVSAFVDAVATGSTPPATTVDALKTTLVTEAAYESARTGERVRIEPVADGGKD